MRGPTLLLALLLAFSGCVGGTPTSTDAPIATEATVNDSTGGIEGLVTDDELVPISGAQVSVVGGQPVRTDEAGRFALSNLEPKMHVLFATRLGYFEKQAKAEVKVGEVARVDIVLQKIPVAEPRFNEVTKWDDKLPVSDACAERDSGQWREETRGFTWQRYMIPVNATKPDGTDLLAIEMDIDLKHKTSDVTLDIDMRLYDKAGKQLQTSGSAGADEHINLQKVMPPGEYFLHVCYWAGAQAEYRITTTITYEQGERATYLRANPKEIDYPED